MSSGSNVVTAYVVQDDKDVVPDTGWKILPNTSNSLNVTTNLTTSEMVDGSLVQRAGMVTSAEAGGDIVHELLFGTFDDMLAAAMGSDWESNELVLGKLNKRFAITKDFGFDSGGAYYLWTGASVSTLGLEINTDGLIGLTVGYMALGYQSSNTESFAVSPEPADKGLPFSALSVGDVLKDGVKIDTCIEALTFNIDKQSEVQRCIGNKLYGGNVINKIPSITGSLTLAFGPTAYNILELQREGETFAIKIPIIRDGVGYEIELPQVQITGDIPSPSGTDVVTAEVSYTVVNESPIIRRVGVV